MAFPIDRRKSKRIDVRIPAVVSIKGSAEAKTIGAEILSISEGGAFVHCTAPIAIGTEVMVEIQFGETKILEAKVTDFDRKLSSAIPGNSAEPSVIRWARGSSLSGFGIEFSGLKSDKRDFLMRLVLYFESLERAGVTFPQN